MAALLFIGIWVALGLTAFFIGVSGGPGGARARLYGTGKGARRTTAVLITVIFVGMGIAIPAVVIAGNHHNDEAGAARVQLNSHEEKGRELFGQICQQCHTLAASDAVGKVGPNLDKLKPPKSLVVDAVINGRAQGAGTMPAGLYTGQDAQDVAAYVAAVAGKQ
jgi:mono/diheme cytochrome c family protein